MSGKWRAPDDGQKVENSGRSKRPAGSRGLTAGEGRASTVGTLSSSPSSPIPSAPGGCPGDCGLELGDCSCSSAAGGSCCEAARSGEHGSEAGASGALSAVPLLGEGRGDRGASQRKSVE